MANQLCMAKQHSIITLADRGWSQRRIARELGVDRGTVRRYLGPGQRVRDRDGPGDSALASDATVSNAAISTAGSAGRRSECEPFRERIIAGVERGLSAQRIWQDLSDDQALQRFEIGHSHRLGRCMG